VRQGLPTLLEAVLSCEVVGEAADGREAIGLVGRLKPDVLVVDQPDLNGLEVIQRIREDNDNTRIVVLSMYSDEGYVREALRAGAQAYVLKEARADEFLHAVREAVAGRRYLSPPLSERAIRSYVQQVGGPTLDSYDTLSIRERDVLHLSAKGYTAAQIAERLTISNRTVESHRANMMRKLGLQTQTDLLRYALRTGIIVLEE